jgi:hydrogenase-4 component H
MGILQIILQNLGHRPRTRWVNDPVPFPENYRGIVLYHRDRCIGCRICAYVCAPAAITFTDNADQSVDWCYFIERCTFCGRCVDFCPTVALSFDRSAPDVTGDRSRHRIVKQVPHRNCPRCGKRVRPLPQSLLKRHYGDTLPTDIVELSCLCEECRRRGISERLKRAYEGREQTEWCPVRTGGEDDD